MRVISGKYRGKVLTPPKDYLVRPTTDRVKEMIFDVLQFRIPNCSFMDLFSGSGSMGIEAISRGAKSVILNDLSKDSIDLIKYNMKNIKEDSAKITQNDYRDALRFYKGKLDILFIDAPYAMDVIEDILDILNERDILKEDSYVVYEHDIGKHYELPTNFFVKKVKVVGNIQVDFIQKTNRVCAITGSFDPITIGHINLVDAALKDFDKIIFLVAHNEAKQDMFNSQERVQIAKKALEDYKNVSVELCEGYVYMYLNKKRVSTIFRGYRNQRDFAYETEMAKYNEKMGGIITLLMQADEESGTISSTRVKECLKNGQSIKGLVPKNVVKLITKIYEEKN